jgi:beta-glucosidase
MDRSLSAEQRAERLIQALTLGAFQKLELSSGKASQASLRVDPRLLAVFDVARNAWHITPGDYTVTLASSARDTGASVSVRLAERWLPAGAGAAR